MTDETFNLDDGLRHLSQLVLADETLETTLQRIVDVATRALPGVIGVSITLRKGRHPYTAVASSAPVQAIDEREYTNDEGPCISAMETGEVQVLDDGTTETRWPRFAQICREEGLGSCLGVPLCVGEEVYGAMNVYAAIAHAFGEEPRQAAELLARQASIALANARTYGECGNKIRQLQDALETRVIIEQAKGILMVTNGCDADGAFDLLKRRSQRSNQKLRSVAEAVVSELLASR